MPPLTGAAERFAPRATGFCIDERLLSSGRSRSSSLAAPVKGRAWRHRLLRVPACMSNRTVLQPSLKLSGCLMSLWLLSLHLWDLLWTRDGSKWPTSVSSTSQQVPTLGPFWM